MNNKSIIKPLCIGILCGIGLLANQVIAQVSETSFDVSGSKIKLPKDIVASYQGGQVTDKEWKDFLVITPWQKKGSPLTPEDVSWKHKLLKEYVENKVIYLEAVKEKLDQDPDFKKGYEDAEIRLLLDILFKTQVRDKAVPTEEEMQTYYNENKEQFSTPETFSIRHIFVDTSKTRKTEKEKDEALKKIQEAYAQLQKGEDFSLVAKEFSESEADKRGEVNGPFKRGEILKDIEDAALSLQSGHYSDILTTKHGYTIVYLEEHKLAYMNPYSEVKNAVQNRLESIKIPPLKEKVIQDAKDFAKVVQHNEYLTDSTAKDNSILLELTGYKMTLGDLKKLEKDIPNKLNPEQEKMFLSSQAETKSLVLYAKKLKLDQDPTVLQFKKTQLIDFWINKEISKQLKITDDEIKDYYQKNTSLFQAPQEIYAYNILIKTDLSLATTAVLRSEAFSVAKDTAEWILAQIKKGEDFSELAKKYSSSANAKDGGLIGWISMGPMGRKFDMAAFKLKPGEISDLVDLSDGYMIIKVTDTHPSSLMTFEKAKDRAQQLVEINKRNKLRDKVLEDKLTSLKLKYDFNRL